MSHSYSENELQAHPLVDEDQWGRLGRELGIDTLLMFVDEFFEETSQLWMQDGPDFDPEQTQTAGFRSQAHRSAGVAGTIGFVKLRHVFLCLEYSQSSSSALRYIELMRETFDQTKQWVYSQHSPH
jgi:HPt (histidine-containing phosphotransfer) domain-containing protein